MLKRILGSGSRKAKITNKKEKEKQSEVLKS
jgi:hypothetical protein